MYNILKSFQDICRKYQNGCDLCPFGNDNNCFFCGIPEYWNIGNLNIKNLTYNQIIFLINAKNQCEHLNCSNCNFCDKKKNCFFSEIPEFWDIDIFKEIKEIDTMTKDYINVQLVFRMKNSLNIISLSKDEYYSSKEDYDDILTNKDMIQIGYIFSTQVGSVMFYENLGTTITLKENSTNSCLTNIIAHLIAHFNCANESNPAYSFSSYYEEVFNFIDRINKKLQEIAKLYLNFFNKNISYDSIYYILWAITVKDNFDIADFLEENLTFTFAEQLYIDKDIKYDIYDLKRIDPNVIYQLDNEGFVLMSK